MANLRMAAWRLLDKYDVDVPEDFLREMLELLVNLLMEAEISELIGAERYERSESRTDHRNGVRQRRWDTRVGTLDLEVPRLRETEYFPSFLDRRRRSEQAMLAVVQEAYVNGVSTRKVDRLVQSLGIEGVSKSQVSAICTEFDEVVEAWRDRGDVRRSGLEALPRALPAQCPGPCEEVRGRRGRGPHPLHLRSDDAGRSQ